MSRGLLIFFLVICGMAAGLYFAGPAIKKRFIGQSFQTNVKYFKAVDIYDIKDDSGANKPCTVVDLELSFPMGSAPENIAELEVRDEKGKPLEVFWDRPDVQDDEDKRVTRWTFREPKHVYFPYLFRKGMLRTKTRDLTELRLPKQMPFESAAGVDQQ